MAGRAAGVAHAHRHVLIGGEPLKIFVGVGDEVFVVDDVAQAGFDGAGGVDEDVMFDAGDFVGDALVQGEQAGFDEDDLVFGVVYDVGELFGEEADVERVADGPRAGDGEVEFHVLIIVPGEGSYAVAGLDAQVDEGFGEAFDALVHVPIGGAVPGTIGLESGDGFVGEHAVGVFENTIHRQLVIHHQAVHGGLLYWLRGKGNAGILTLFLWNSLHN